MVWKRLKEQAAFATGNFGTLFGNLELPPLPEVTVRLLGLLARQDAELSEVADVISSDAGVATRVLQIINSASFGLSRTVSDVRRAVTLLGLERINSIVLAYTTMNTLPRRVEGFDTTLFWQDSLLRAVFARNLNVMLGWEGKDEAFTGALLQNLSQPLLFQHWAKYYGPIVAEAEEHNGSLVELEDQRLCWNHAQAGAWVAKNWGFPDLLVCCIGLHHTGIEELDQLGMAATPVMAVALSSSFPGSKYVQLLGLDQSDHEDLSSRTFSTCGEMARIFGIPVPRLPDSNDYST